MSVDIPPSFFENASPSGATTAAPARTGAPAGAAEMSSVYAPPASAGVDASAVHGTSSVFPDAPMHGAGGQAELEELRRQHLSHEGSVRALGVLYYLNGIANGLAGIVGLVEFFTKDASAAEEVSSLGASIIPGLLFLAIGAFVFATGRALRKLSPTAYTPTMFISVLGLLAFPAGTLISLAVLFQLNSKKGKFVLSPGYADIVARTPDVKAKTSPLVKFLLAFVILVIIAVAVTVVYIGSR